MLVTRNEILKIAHLARLDVSNNIEEITNDFNNILCMFEQMKDVNTDNVKTLSHPLDIIQRLREDIVCEENHRDEYQKTAELINNGFYIVPKVIE